MTVSITRHTLVLYECATDDDLIHLSAARLHFCQPEGGPQKQPESLGSILWGDRIFNSPFEINMLEK
jgi:hypothetical protein